MGLVRIGRVVRAIGLRGQLGVAGSDGGLARLARITLRRDGDLAEPAAHRLLEARPQGKVWAVRLDGIDDRTSAEGLIGCEVLAERAELGDADEGSFYWGDLEGLPVRAIDGKSIGRVSGFFATGGVDVLVVAGDPDGRELLIPLAPYVEVDLVARVIRVDPPEGLLEVGQPGGGEGSSGGTPG